MGDADGRDAEDDGAGDKRMVPEIMVAETMAPNTTICIQAGSAVSKSWMQTNGCGASGVQRMEYNWGCLCGAGRAETEGANKFTGKYEVGSRTRPLVHQQPDQVRAFSNPCDLRTHVRCISCAWVSEVRGGPFARRITRARAGTGGGDRERARTIPQSKDNLFPRPAQAKQRGGAMH